MEKGVEGEVGVLKRGRIYKNKTKDKKGSICRSWARRFLSIIGNNFGGFDMSIRTYASAIILSPSVSLGYLPRPCSLWRPEPPPSIWMDFIGHLNNHCFLLDHDYGKLCTLHLEFINTRWIMLVEDWTTTIYSLGSSSSLGLLIPLVWTKKEEKRILQFLPRELTCYSPG